jgi:hypothetical protein
MLSLFVDQLFTYPDKSLSDCANDAYKIAFGNTHPYLIKCMVWAAIKILFQSRQRFMQEIKVNDVSEFEQMNADFKVVYDNLTLFLNEKMKN